MRRSTNKARLRQFLEAFSRATKGPGVVYLTGGATALLLGIRSETIDIDLKFDPEPSGVFEAIAKLKNELQVNVELASPDQFVPEILGWKERSQLIEKFGQIEVRHYDFYSQALAKLERGHPNDLQDVAGYIRLGHVEPRKLVRFFDSIRADLIKYPAINAVDFEQRVNEFLSNYLK